MAKPSNKGRVNARDQFAALGFFIQNFEFLVSIFRGSCSEILRGGRRGVQWTEPKVIMANWKIYDLVFHHESMMARSIATVWRALVFEESQAMVLLSKMSEKSNSVAQDVANEILSEAYDIIDIRNRLIHATWKIGFWLPQDNFKTIRVEKSRIGRDGLKQRDDLPRSFRELMDQGKRAGRLASKLGRFLQFLIYEPNKIEIVFKKIGKKWTFVPVPAKQKTSRKKRR